MSRLRSQLDNLMAQHGQTASVPNQVSMPMGQRAFSHSDPGFVEVQRQLDAFGQPSHPPLSPTIEHMPPGMQPYGGQPHVPGTNPPHVQQPWPQGSQNALVQQPAAVPAMQANAPQAPFAHHQQPFVAADTPQQFANVAPPVPVQHAAAVPAHQAITPTPTPGPDLQNIKSSLDRLTQKLQATAQAQGNAATDSLISAQRAATEALATEVRSEFGKVAEILGSMQRFLQQNDRDTQTAGEFAKVNQLIQQLVTNQAGQPEQIGYVVGEIQNLKSHVDQLAATGTPQVDFGPLQAELSNSFSALGSRLEMLGSDQNALNNLVQRVEQSHAELSGKLDTIAQGGGNTDTTELIVQVGALQHSIEHLPVSIDGLNQQFNDLSVVVQSMANQGNVDPSIGEFNAINERLDEITRGLVSLSTNSNSSSPDLGRLDARLDEINHNLSFLSQEPAAGAAVPESMGQIEARLDEITRGLMAISTGGKNDGGELERIEARVASLTKTVDKFVAGGAVSASGGDISLLASIPQEVKSSLGSFESRLNSLASQSDLSKEVMQSLSAFESRLEEISSHAAQQTQPAGMSATDASIQNEILASLNAMDSRLSVMDGTINTMSAQPTEPASGAANYSMPREFSEFSQSVQSSMQAIESKISRVGTDKAIELDGLASQINRLSEKLDELTAVPINSDQGETIALAHDNEAVFDKLEDIVRRIDVLNVQVDSQTDQQIAPVAHPMPDNAEAFASIEAQLNQIAAQMGPIEVPEFNTSVLEEQLSRIEHGMASSRDVAIEVANQAAENAAQMAAHNVAENVVQSVISQMPQAAPASVAPPEGMQGFDTSLLQSLAEEVRGLSENANSQSTSSFQTFENVQQSIASIAERLGGLEEQMGSSAARSIDAIALLAEQSQNSTAQIQEMITAAANIAPASVTPAQNYGVADQQLATEQSGEQYSANEAAFAQQSQVNQPMNADPAMAGEMAVTNSDPSRGYSESQSLDYGMQQPIVDPITAHSEGYGSPAAGNYQDLPEVSDAPSIQEMRTPEVAPVEADLPLEPGSGMPPAQESQEQSERDVMDRAQAELASSNAGGSDFISRARKAAQAAQLEANDFGQEIKAAKVTEKVKKQSLLSSLPDLFAKRKKVVLIAAAAIFMAALAGPLAMNFMGGSKKPVAAVAPVVSPVATTKSDTKPEEPKVAEFSKAKPAENIAEPVKQSDSIMTAPKAEEVAGTSFSEKTQPATRSFEKSDGKFADVMPANPGDLNAALAALKADASVANVALQQSVADGNPAALFEVGRRYTDGVGVERDLAEAAKWYEVAAAKGYGPAQYRLGNFYEKGHGVEREMNKAAAWYNQAANQGNALAMHNLAVINATGVLGSKPDMETAVKWFTEAANYGVKDSQVNLGILYTRGMGVKADTIEAYKWFAIASRAGDSDASGKRDTVANAMRPEQLEKARAEAAIWKPRQLNENANTVIVPDSWKNTATKTAGLSSSQMIKVAQDLLTRQGFDPGPADGVMGAKTKTAIMAFQQRSGLSVNGILTTEVLNKLRAETI